MDSSTFILILSAIIIGYLVLSYIALSVLYFSYVLLMKYLASQNITKKSQIKGFKNKSIVFLFVVYDIYCNWFHVSIIGGFEIPKQLTVTSRMKMWRKKYEPRGFYTLNPIEQFRLLSAVWLCEELLDRDDILNEGDHC